MPREMTLPRTWDVVDAGGQGVLALDGVRPKRGERVVAIEASPLLDLLAFYIGQPNGRYTMSEDAERDAEAILRANGRPRERVQ